METSIREPLIQYVGPIVDKKEEEKVPVVEAEPMMTDEEKLKRSYLKELKEANISDNAYVENLMYMMGMGYLNFRVNFNLLVRNNNDLVISINKLCNNMVTESIFEQ